MTPSARVAFENAYLSLRSCQHHLDKGLEILNQEAGSHFQDAGFARYDAAHAASNLEKFFRLNRMKLPVPS